MLLGKRPRPPVIRRTTSMSGIGFDLDLHRSNVESHQPSPTIMDSHAMEVAETTVVQADQRYINHFAAMVSPRANITATLDHHPRRCNHESNSPDFIETAHFLRICALCKRRLLAGQDIYMYRGDAAFCSSECRERQMKLDKKKDNSSKLGSFKNEGR